MEARKVTFTAKPGTFRDAVRAYKKYKEEKEQRLERKLQQLEKEIYLEDIIARFDAEIEMFSTMK